MSWIAPTASILEILLLLYVATMDVATRLIRNEFCLALALLGIAGQLPSPIQVAVSLITAALLFLLLFILYARGGMGGGDVKLLVALAVGLPPSGATRLRIRLADRAPARANPGHASALSRPSRKRSPPAGSVSAPSLAPRATLRASPLSTRCRPSTLDPPVDCELSTVDFTDSRPRPTRSRRPDGT